ncbi:MAG: CopG family transcriptional regulator [Reyranella sp.]|nr:CopG family transcriptional regulator [Reyranella sp.]
MPAKPILNVRLSPETLRKLDAVAAATRRTRSFIANEALEAWVERELALIEELQIALEEGRAGKGIPHDKAMRQIDMAVERAIKRGSRRKVVRK